LSIKGMSHFVQKKFMGFGVRSDPTGSLFMHLMCGLDPQEAEFDGGSSPIIKSILTSFKLLLLLSRSSKSRDFWRKSVKKTIQLDASKSWEARAPSGEMSDPPELFSDLGPPSF
jgi:hypothetical protein